MFYMSCSFINVVEMNVSVVVFLNYFFLHLFLCHDYFLFFLF